MRAEQANRTNALKRNVNSVLPRARMRERERGSILGKVACNYGNEFLISPEHVESYGMPSLCLSRSSTDNCNFCEADLNESRGRCIFVW